MAFSCSNELYSQFTGSPRDWIDKGVRRAAHGPGGLESLRHGYSDKFGARVGEIGMSDRIWQLPAGRMIHRLSTSKRCGGSQAHQGGAPPSWSTSPSAGNFTASQRHLINGSRLVLLVWTSSWNLLS